VLGGLGASALKAVAKAAFDQALQYGWLDVQQTLIPGTRNRRDGIFVRWNSTPWAANPNPGPFAI
jgi:hypothetical protein